MSRQRVALVVAIAAIVAGFTSGYLAQQAPPNLVRGTLIRPNNAPAPNRVLLFLASANNKNVCPVTCSCDTGTCSGGDGCKGKLCVYGFIARTNGKGSFGIRLPEGLYDVHLDSASESTRLERDINPSERKEPLNLRIPLALDKGVADR